MIKLQTYLKRQLTTNESFVPLYNSSCTLSSEWKTCQAKKFAFLCDAGGSCPLNGRGSFQVVFRFRQQFHTVFVYRRLNYQQARRENTLDLNECKESERIGLSRKKRGFSLNSFRQMSAGYNGFIRVFASSLHTGMALSNRPPFSEFQRVVFLSRREVRILSVRRELDEDL